MANEKVDVVIVGAGASGSVYAAVLAKAGNGRTPPTVKASAPRVEQQDMLTVSSKVPNHLIFRCKRPPDSSWRLT
jgi:ketopantoate reductase